MNECKNFPGIDGNKVDDISLKSHLFTSFDEELIENISYKQWLNSGAGLRLDTVTRSATEFIDDFCEQLLFLNRHDFIAQKQSEYLKKLKNELNEDEVIALLDFSENLSFEIQFQIQSYYYNKPQCTIHPICTYYRENNEIKNFSIIIIAESLEHNVNSVYLFQRKMIDFLKKSRRNTKKVLFFSDGAGSQYKNKKNFLNLCLFKKDFGLDAEWNFFATCHGKSPCDALGGSFKRNSRNFNLKNTLNPIDSAKKLYEWAITIQNSKVEFIFCSQKEYEDTESFLNQNRFGNRIKTIKGTHSFHSYTPMMSNEFRLERIRKRSMKEFSIYRNDLRIQNKIITTMNIDNVFS